MHYLIDTGFVSVRLWLGCDVVGRAFGVAFTSVETHVFADTLVLVVVSTKSVITNGQPLHGAAKRAN